jgi:hypothetical protein
MGGQGNRMWFRHGNCAIDPKGFHAVLTFRVHLWGGSGADPVAFPPTPPCSFAPANRQPTRLHAIALNGRPF